MSDDADAGPALSIDRDNSFKAHLKVRAGPDQARVDCADRDGAVAEIIGDRRRELRFDYGNQMINEVGELVIVNLRFQIRHAVLNRRAVDQELRNRGVLHDIKGSGRYLITDLSGDGEGAYPARALRKVAESLTEIERPR